jgi:hypothetical protein
MHLDPAPAVAPASTVRRRVGLAVLFVVFALLAARGAVRNGNDFESYHRSGGWFLAGRDLYAFGDLMPYRYVPGVAALFAPPPRGGARRARGGAARGAGERPPSRSWRTHSPAVNCLDDRNCLSDARSFLFWRTIRGTQLKLRGASVLRRSADAIEHSGARTR